ncbi:MAG: hypothetical protein AAF658_02170 [Myxococcota bacterium]
MAIATVSSPGSLRAEEDFTVTKARTESELGKTSKEVSTACGAAVKSSVDWTTMTESVVEGYSVSSYCGNPLEALVDLCKGAAAKKFIKKKVKALVCTFGGKDKRDLTVEGGTITFTVDFDSGNNEEYARRELIKKL